jgi:hypothetical protein
VFGELIPAILTEKMIPITKVKNTSYGRSTLFNTINKMGHLPLVDITPAWVRGGYIHSRKKAHLIAHSDGRGLVMFDFFAFGVSILFLET